MNLPGPNDWEITRTQKALDEKDLRIRELEERLDLLDAALLEAWQILNKIVVPF